MLRENRARPPRAGVSRPTLPRQPVSTVCRDADDLRGVKINLNVCSPSVEAMLAAPGFLVAQGGKRFGESLKGKGV